MIKRLLMLLILCGQCAAQDKEEEFSERLGPVLKVRVMQQGRCPKGIPCTPVQVACGSCVLVDGKKTTQGTTNYTAVSAAHVVTKDCTQLTKTDKQWNSYPVDHYLEVQTDGKWKACRLKYVSKYSDICMLTFASSADLQLVCVSQTTPKKDDVLRVVGYKECDKLTTLPAVSLWTDEGSESLDAFHRTPENIAPGMSGGAVLDSHGDLVGITVGFPTVSQGSVGVFTGQIAVKRFVDSSLDK